MAAPKELDPTVSLAALLGKKVRKHRERRVWTQREVGNRLNFSHNRIAQVELGTDPPTWDMCVALDAVLEANGELTELWNHMVRERAREQFPDWARKFMLLEAKATKMCKYMAHTVPGLLQTEEYARALLRAGHPLSTEAEVEERVVARLSRQKLLGKAAPPLLWTVLDEAVLRRPVGGPHTMHQQLVRIIEATRHPHVTVQVLPFDRGEHGLMDSSLTLLSFADGPDVAYQEGSDSGILMESVDQVAKYSLAYDLVRVSALPPDASLALIENAMEDDYTCTHDPT